MKIVDKVPKGFYDFKEIEEIDVVKEILTKVKNDGDSSVAFYTKKFDNLDLKCFEITKKEIDEAYKLVDKETITAIKKAAKRIEAFARKQMQCFKDFSCTENGITLGQRIISLEKVGCYVPGGRYPLPSTALMTVIPAKVVGVKEIIVCSPKIKTETIVAADIAGASRIFNIGGIQAIGAMAFGTETIPKVDKIVGPGNKYVTSAKKEVYGVVGIDFLAGPSEIMIIADKNANAKFIAADLLAQAEHDPNAIVDLITISRKLAEEVNKELEKQLSVLKTKEIAEKALENGFIVIVDTLKICCEIANKKAPEHLELQIKNPEALMSKLRNYGSLFIGENTAEVFGDYCSGINHTLPTNGAARYTAGLSVKDFVKIATFQEIDEDGKEELIPIASKLAEIEGLDAHRKAALDRKGE